MIEERPAVWNRPEQGERGPAPARSRSQITAVAIELADEGGLAAVSMRQVAQRLGAGPASLYRYVATRDELLELMADAVSGEIDLGETLSENPVEDLLALATRAKQVHLRHTWLLDLPTEPARGPRGMDYLEQALRALAPVPASRLSQPARLETIGLLNGLVTLFARTELRRGGASRDPQLAHASYLAAAATEEHHPHITAALAGSAGAEVGEGADGAEVGEDTHTLFERMVRRVLAGLIDTS